MSASPLRFLRYARGFEAGGFLCDLPLPIMVNRSCQIWWCLAKKGPKYPACNPSRKLSDEHVDHVLCTFLLSSCDSFRSMLFYFIFRVLSVLGDKPHLPSHFQSALSSGAVWLCVSLEAKPPPSQILLKLSEFLSMKLEEKMKQLSEHFYVVHWLPEIIWYFTQSKQNSVT